MYPYTWGHVYVYPYNFTRINLVQVEHAPGDILSKLGILFSPTLIKDSVVPLGLGNVICLQVSNWRLLMTPSSHSEDVRDYPHIIFFINYFLPSKQVLCHKIIFLNIFGILRVNGKLKWYSIRAASLIFHVLFYSFCFTHCGFEGLVIGWFSIPVFTCMLTPLFLI